VDGEAMVGRVSDFTVAVGPPVGTWAEISGHDMTHVQRDVITVARHF